MSTKSNSNIHFWMPEPPDEQTLTWEPDAQPAMFPTGIGHAFLELYRRLSLTGCNVSIGPNVKRNDHLVFYLRSIYLWPSQSSNQRPLAQQLRRRRFAALLRECATARSITVIRGDIPLDFRPVIPGATEIMPNQTSVIEANQIWLPLLPQRGMLPRDNSRYGSIRAVGLMANRDNVPDYLLNQEFGNRLSQIDVAWQPAFKDFAAPTAPAWHDFRELDAVLCVREDSTEKPLLRKPATKLINAWAAGVIPFIEAEPAYLELAKPGTDAILIHSLSDIVDVIEQLKHAPHEIRQLEQGVAARRSEFSVTQVLSRWIEVLYRDRSISRIDRGALLVLATKAAAATALRSAKRAMY